MLLSQSEVRQLIAESGGMSIDADDATISFNKKELAFPPDDIFNTRAAGKLSTQALIDVCQCELFVHTNATAYRLNYRWKLKITEIRSTKIILSLTAEGCAVDYYK